MKIRLYQSRLTRLLQQRTGAYVLIVALIVLNLMQTIVLMPLLNHQKTILVPTPLDQTVWLSHHDISASYVITMTRILCDLRFNLTPSNAESQVSTLLRYVHPRFYGRLKHQLATEAKRLKKDHMSSVFYPTDMRLMTNGNHKLVQVTGDLSVWLDQHQMMTAHKQYQFKFVYRHGQLQLIGLNEVKQNEEEHE